MSKIAIFFDAENVPAAKMPGIISFLSKKGDIIFQRAYADWSVENTKSWKSKLSEMPIAAIQQFHNDEKQAVDKAVMMDAVEMAIKHEDIDIFVIVASDNGYYSLALRLRELGKRVIGIGEKKKCNSIWVKSCNEFSYFEDLEDEDNNLLLKSDEQPDVEEFKDFSLEKFLEQAFDETPPYKDTESVLLTRMWKAVHRLKSDFNVKDYGYQTDREMVESMEIFDVTVGEDNQTYFVAKRIPDKNGSQRRKGEIKRWIHFYCIISADEGGDYFCYMKDMNDDSKNATLKKGTKVEFLVVREPNPKGEDTRSKNGRATDVRILQEDEQHG